MERKPQIALIGAMAENHVIGRDNKLLWRIPEDMRFFVRMTKGHPVIMGRHTFESIGRPLPGRRNIVLTRDPDFHPTGVETVRSVQEALQVIEHAERVSVIGGGKVYEQFLPHADTLFITHIHHTVEGDTLFPTWDSLEWKQTWEQEGDYNIANPYSYTFRQYDRVR